MRGLKRRPGVHNPLGVRHASVGLWCVGPHFKLCCRASTAHICMWRRQVWLPARGQRRRFRL